MQAVSCRNIFRCALLLGTVIACVRPALCQSSEGDDKLPVIYAAKLEGTRIAIDVVSFGCTDASYFSVQLQPVSADVFRLSIIGRKQDSCRMAAHIATVMLEIPAIANLSEARFLLMNRLATPDALRRSAP
jgi:hypothetical protein